MTDWSRGTLHEGLDCGQGSRGKGLNALMFCENTLGRKYCITATTQLDSGGRIKRQILIFVLQSLYDSVIRR